MSNLFKHINQHRQAVAERIEKSFENDIEKARGGTYSDTAENRKLNRVGQKYGGEKKEDDSVEGKQRKAVQDEQKRKQANVEKVGKDTSAAVMRGEVSDNEDGTSDFAKHAANTDTEVLKKVAASDKADPELKAAAEAELKKRGADVAEKQTAALGKEREGKSHLKTKANKKEAALQLQTAWDAYVSGDDNVDAETLKQIIEDAGLTPEDVETAWSKDFKAAGMDEHEIAEELKNIWQSAGVEDADLDIDPEWEPTSKDKKNAAKGEKLRAITDTLDIFDRYVEGNATREEIADAIDKTGLIAEDFAKQAMSYMMEKHGLSRPEVIDTVDNMYEVSEESDDDDETSDDDIAEDDAVDNVDVNGDYSQMNVKSLQSVQKQFSDAFNQARKNHPSLDSSNYKNFAEIDTAREKIIKDAAKNIGMNPEDFSKKWDQVGKILEKKGMSHRNG